MRAELEQRSVSIVHCYADLESSLTGCVPWLCRERVKAVEAAAAAAQQALCPTCSVGCQQAAQAASAALRSELQAVLTSTPIVKAAGKPAHSGTLPYIATAPVKV